MRKLARKVLHNLDLKLVALALAVLTWHYLTTAGMEQRRFRHIGSRILGLPADVAVLAPGLPELDVILEGPRGQLDALEGRELVAEVTLGDVNVQAGQPLKTSVRLLADNLRVAGEPGRSTPLPPGIQFLSAEPASFTLTLESIIERDLPIEAVTKGSPAPGFAVQAAVQPPNVLVRGPFRLLQNLTSIRTEPILVDGLRERLRTSVRLETQVATKEGLATISPARPGVDVLLEVTEKPEDKVIEHVPIRLAAVPEGLAVIRQEGQPREATLKLRGPRRLLDELDARTLAVEAGFQGLAAPETAPKPFSLFFLREHVRRGVGLDTWLPLPPAVDLVEVEPKTVQLLLDRLATRLLPVEPDLEGRPAEDHEVTALALPEKVQVSGPASVLSLLKSIPTEPVLVTGLTERVRRPVRLATAVSAGEFRDVPVTPAQPFVDVLVSVAERRVRKTLEGLPVRVLLTPRPGLALHVELDPKTLGAVTFEGPRSRIERLTADGVAAFVRVAITALTDLRPTLCTVEFTLADPQIRVVPDAKPFTVKLDFPPLEPEPPRGRDAPAPRPGP